MNSRNTISTIKTASIEQIHFLFVWLMFFGMPWSNAFFRIGLYGFIILFPLSGKWDLKFASILNSKIFLSSAALSLLALASLFYTIAPFNLAWIDASRYLKLLTIGALIFILDNDNKRLNLLFAFCAGTAILMLPTLLDGTGIAKLLHLPLQQFENQSYITNESDNSLQNLVYWRNQIAHGFFVSILCFTSLSYAVKLKRYRFSLILLAIACTIDIVFFIHGRMALLSLILALLLFAFFKIKSPKIYTIAIAGILGLAMLSYASIDIVKYRVDSVFSETQNYYQKNDSSSSAGHRLHYWKISFKLFSESKILGAGAGAFRHTLESTKDPFLNENHAHTHNEYITILSQYGIIGFTIFISMLIIAFNSTRKIQTNTEKHCYQAILAIFCLNCLSDSMLYNQDEGWTLVFVLALIAAATRNQADKKLT